RNHRTGENRNVTVWPDNPLGWGGEMLKHRFQWNFPIFFSPHDPKTLYCASQFLCRSTNEGQSWTVVSPDLSTNDKSKQAPSGGPITKDNTSVEYYCTIFSAVESPHEQGVIWCGTDDGLVHITRNGGDSWTNITPPDMPEWGTVSQIDLSAHAKGTAYLAVQRYRLDDHTPYVFKTSDFGRSWKQIGRGIADGSFVRAVREDPVRAGLLYAGTETGMWVSFDDGDAWQPLQMNLPVVPITDLVVKDDDLVVATQGRSFWILRDLSPLRQMTSSVLSASAHLFAPGITFKGIGDTVDVYYALADDLEADITLEILEADGDVIKTYTGKKTAKKEESEGEATEDEDDSEEDDDDDEESESDGEAPAESGLNVFSWNTRYPDATETPGAVMWGGSVRGPQASPGAYLVRLTVGERELTQPFDILGDPRLDASQADYEEQFSLLIEIRDKVNETHTAINQLRAVREQIGAVSSRAKEIGGMQSVIDAGDEIKTKLKAIEDELIQSKSKSSQDPLNFPIMLNNKIAALAGVVSRSSGRPTAASYVVFEQLVAELKPQLEKLGVVMDVDVPAFNKLVREYDMPAIWVEKNGE
ncbi:MAG: glycosyl hydrolase, partial [Planctomycetota bacterium]|nr:glycosyl hydrolase [Planctomycetota bacterium]